MGGFFGAISKRDCVLDIFFGVDYHSHLGTRRGGMAIYDAATDSFQREIHNIENTPFRTKFEDNLHEFHGCSGIGCISVLSNLLPRETREICTKFFNGDVKGAAALQCKYLDLINALFCEVNPIPAKAAMNAMGFCSNNIRLPLTEMEEAHRALLLQRMREVGINV